MPWYTPSIRMYTPLIASVKTRIQADKAADAKAHPDVKKQLGILGTLLSIVKSKGGPAALYRGFVANMANAFFQRT